MKERGLSYKGKVQDLKKRSKNVETPIPTNKEILTKVSGYIGKPIGMVELFYRQGFLNPEEELLLKPKCEDLIKKLMDLKDKKCEVE